MTTRTLAQLLLRRRCSFADQRRCFSRRRAASRRVATVSPSDPGAESCDRTCRPDTLLTDGAREIFECVSERNARPLTQPSVHDILPPASSHCPREHVTCWEQSRRPVFADFRVGRCLAPCDSLGTGSEKLPPIGLSESLVANRNLSPPQSYAMRRARGG